MMIQLPILQNKIFDMNGFSEPVIAKLPGMNSEFLAKKVGQSAVQLKQYAN